MLDLILNLAVLYTMGTKFTSALLEFPCKDHSPLPMESFSCPRTRSHSQQCPPGRLLLSPQGPSSGRRCPRRAVVAPAPLRVFMEEMARSETRTLHLELEVPTPVVMPKINGRADKGWEKWPAETSESSHECSCALLEPPLFGAPGSPQESGSAPKCCRRNALLLLPRHLSALCISILLSCALSSQGSPSPAQPKAAAVAVAMPPQPAGAQSPELGLVTLQCAVFYSLGLTPDPLCTPAGRPGLAITSPPSSLSAAFTWAPPNKQFTFSQAGPVPGFLSVQHPKPDRSCSVSAVVSRHHSIQN